ncbi:hypothetical protein IAT38_000767 [Cryptococcus sp. DSM 104549]
MPPKKAAAPATRKTARTKKAAGLSQPTLAFPSQRKSSLGKPKPALLPHSSITSSEIEFAPTSDAPADDDASDIEIVEPPTSAKTKGKKAVKGDGSKSAEVEETEVEKGKEKRQLKVKSKEWSGVLAEANEAMGNLEPVHAGSETHNDVHHILRVFDMTTKYGPCIGMPRLQRWERAKAWGLNPPEEIREILTTQQGEEDESYRENVLHRWL